MGKRSAWDVKERTLPGGRTQSCNAPIRAFATLTQLSRMIRSSGRRKPLGKPRGVAGHPDQHLNAIMS